MTVSFTQPHDPYVSRQEFWDLYRDEDIDSPRVPAIPVAEMDEHSRSLHYHYNLHRFQIDEETYRRARQPRSSEPTATISRSRTPRR